MNLTQIKPIFSLISRYWKSEEKKSAYAYVLGIAALTIAAVYMTLLLNEWFNEFYSALQAYDSEAVYNGLLKFTVLAFAHIIFAVYAYYLQQTLSLRWRRWLTKSYLSRWTGKTLYYRMEMFADGTDNPDQRISEDINLFTARTLSFATGLLRSITTIFCFIFVLYKLSGDFSFPLMGHTIAIPGYLVWAALLYSVIGTWLTHLVGKKLISLHFTQQKREADFRYAMVRLREMAESIAFYSGTESAEKEGHILRNRFAKVVSNSIFIIKKEKELSWLTNFYGQVAIIFPFLVAAPRYLSKGISLGGLMQIANCFGKVQESMSYFVDVYASLAEWRSCVNRLLTFDAHMEELEKEGALSHGKLTYRMGDAIGFENLTIRLPSGKTILENRSETAKIGDRIIVKGPSGKGKTTLFRVLAGLWPYGEGNITMPARDLVFFLPQKPYLPIGTLKEAAIYPELFGDEEEIKKYMTLAGLSHLIPHLNEVSDWSHKLSLGEQQRLAFVRLFLLKPKYVLLDEATSAMDEAMEEKMYRELLKDKERTILSIGHRSTLDQFHNKVWNWSI